MQCLTRASPMPVVQQFVPMQLRPRHDEANVPATERAVDQLERIDTDLRLAIGMQGMKVRRVMIVEVHRDDEPEKATNRRHVHIVIAPPVDASVTSSADLRKCCSRVDASVPATEPQTPAPDDDQERRSRLLLDARSRLAKSAGTPTGTRRSVGERGGSRMPALSLTWQAPSRSSIGYRRACEAGQASCLTP